MTAYITLDEADEYHDARISGEAWNALSDEEKERRLMTASDFLDFNYPFTGEKAELHQVREFPRKGFEQLGVPNAVRYAVCELALQDNLNQNAEQKMTSVKVGSLSVNYAEKSLIESNLNRFDYVRQLLTAWIDRNCVNKVSILRG